MNFDDVRERIFVPPPPEFFDVLDRTSVTLSPTLKSAQRTFRSNLESAINVASVPYLMAAHADFDMLYQRIYTAERIRAINPDTGDIPDVSDSRIGQRAMELLNARVKTDEGQEERVLNIASILRRHLSDPDFSHSADELLRQTAVSVWGSLEVLLVEAIDTLLHVNPSLTSKLVEHPTTRTMFPNSVPLSVVTRPGFNSCEFIRQSLFTDWGGKGFGHMKDVVAVIVGNAGDVLARLNEKLLWILYQQRHLIVHNRGIVDHAYLNATGHHLPIGSKLVLTCSGIDAHLEAVLNAGSAILAEFSEAVPAFSVSDGGVI